MVREQTTKQGNGTMTATEIKQHISDQIEDRISGTYAVLAYVDVPIKYGFRSGTLRFEVTLHVRHGESSLYYASHIATDDFNDTYNKTYTGLDKMAKAIARYQKKAGV